MAIYVDELTLYIGDKKGCKMTADTLGELHLMAILLKLSKDDFAECPRYPDNEKTSLWGWVGRKKIGHREFYAIKEDVRKKALKLGAISVKLGEEPWRALQQKKWDTLYAMKAEAEREALLRKNPRLRKQYRKES